MKTHFFIIVSLLGYLSTLHASETSLELDDISVNVEGNPTYNFNGQAFAASDSNVLDAFKLSRDELSRAIARGINKLHPQDTEYIRNQLQNEAPKWQQATKEYLQLIGILLGFNVRFFSAAGGMGSVPSYV